MLYGYSEALRLPDASYQRVCVRVLVATAN